MTRFLDGPAAGQVLLLARAPLLLRVVKAAGGPFDALDRPDDEPRDHESITVYRRVGEAGWAMLDGRHRDGRRWGGRCAVAAYRVLTVQPGDGHTRTNDAWRAWCEAQGSGAGVQPRRAGTGVQP
jgi:hypothetical protein